MPVLPKPAIYKKQHTNGTSTSPQTMALQINNTSCKRSHFVQWIPLEQTQCVCLYSCTFAVDSHCSTSVFTHCQKSPYYCISWSATIYKEEIPMVKSCIDEPPSIIELFVESNNCCDIFQTKVREVMLRSVEWVT